MTNPWEFLSAWAREHVNATAYDDKVTAANLATEGLRDAKQAGVSEAGIIKAAGGNLAGWMLSELNSAADKEVERLARKD
jgi:hypothetical protein